MSPSHEFIASLLDRGGPAYANLAAQRLLTNHPGLAPRYGPQAMAQWRSNLALRMLDLTTAVELDAPALFAESVGWSRESFAARGLPEGDLKASIESLRDVLREELPADTTEAVAAAIDHGLHALETPTPAPEAPGQRPPLSRLALDYMEACLRGEPARATRLILDALHEGLSIPDACNQVLLPSLGEAGRLWHAGRFEIHEEHLVTAVTQRVLGALAAAAHPTTGNGRTVLGAPVQGNAHDTVVRVIMLLFEIEGWNALGLGTDLSPEDIGAASRDHEAHLLVMSATLIPHLRAMRASIQAVRAVSPRTRILVGGRAFAAGSQIAQTIGADALASSARDVVQTGARLVGLA